MCIYAHICCVYILICTSYIHTQMYIYIACVCTHTLSVWPGAAPFGQTSGSVRKSMNIQNKWEQETEYCPTLKMSTSQSPEPVNMSPFMEKGTCIWVLRTLSWGRDLGLPRWTQCNYKSTEKQNLSQLRAEEVWWEKPGCKDATPLPLKWRKGSWVKKCRWPPEVGEGRETGVTWSLQ